MATRADVVREARSWLKTRYRHQGRIKGLAADCGGMVYGVGLALGLLPPVEDLPAAFLGYPQIPGAAHMLETCSYLLLPIALAAMQPGDVVLMRFNDQPQHVAILGDYAHGGLSLIHAYAPLRRVTEARLDDVMRARIVGAYTFPGVSA